MMKKNIIKEMFVAMIVCSLVLSTFIVARTKAEETNIVPDSNQSPIRKYFTTQKIIWSLDDYYVSRSYKINRFQTLTDKITSFGGNVNINVVFIDEFGVNPSVIKNYSSLNDLGISQSDIDLSLAYFSLKGVYPQSHGWNHVENLDGATLQEAYKIVNYTLWNLWNNYGIKANFFLGHNYCGNYYITFALKKFSEKYWTVYGETFLTDDKRLFPYPSAIHYITEAPYVTLFDPLFGCDWGTPCKTVEEAQTLYTSMSNGKEIIFIRGHPSSFSSLQEQTYFTMWKSWIDWIYNTHTLININHTQAIEYICDRNNFQVSTESSGNFTIDCTKCSFSHNVLFTNPDGITGRVWSLYDTDGTFISSYDSDTMIFLKNGHAYKLCLDSYTPPEPPVNNAPYIPSNGIPLNNANNIPISTTLSWTGGDPDGDIVTYDVYFGTTTSPSKVSSNQTISSLSRTSLSYKTVYYWRIVSWDSHGLSSVGPLWSFTTVEEAVNVNHPPNIPSNPYPANGATNVPTVVTFTWTGGDPDPGDTVTYCVYLSTSSSRLYMLSSGFTPDLFCTTGRMTSGTTWYWKVVAKDSHGSITQGPIWKFTTKTRR